MADVEDENAALARRLRDRERAAVVYAVHCAACGWSPAPLTVPSRYAACPHCGGRMTDGPAPRREKPEAKKTKGR